MIDEEMCPNCVTPWKCNGPHVLSGGCSCRPPIATAHICAEQTSGRPTLLFETAAASRLAEQAATARADEAEASLRRLIANLESLSDEQWLNPVNYSGPVADVLRTLQRRLSAILTNSAQEVSR